MQYRLLEVEELLTICISSERLEPFLFAPAGFVKALWSVKA